MFEDIFEDIFDPCDICSNKKCVCRTCRGEKQCEYSCECGWDGKFDCYKEFNKGDRT
jgi:hypothetical protein